MKSLSIKDKWSGYFSDILNYLKEHYPKVVFERAIYDKSLILNIPQEYSMYYLHEDLVNNFNYDYNITILDEKYEYRLILINKFSNKAEGSYDSIDD